MGRCPNPFQGVSAELDPDSDVISFSPPEGELTWPAHRPALRSERLEERALFCPVLPLRLRSRAARLLAPCAHRATLDPATVSSPALALPLSLNDFSPVKNRPARAAGDYPYWAPEYSKAGEASLAADIYCFGLILVRRPFSNRLNLARDLRGPACARADPARLPVAPIRWSSTWGRCSISRCGQSRLFQVVVAVSSATVGPGTPLP